MPRRRCFRLHTALLRRFHELRRLRELIEPLFWLPIHLQSLCEYRDMGQAAKGLPPADRGGIAIIALQPDATVPKSAQRPAAHHLPPIPIHRG